MNKRTLLTVICLTISFCCIATNFECNGIWYYVLSDDEKTVGVGGTDNSLLYEESIVIPSEVSYMGTKYQVTCIGEEAFESHALTSVNIPYGVTTIDNRAFMNCNRLASVAIPSSVTTIGFEAFYQCFDLSTATIPDGVSSIGYNAFSSCYGLSSVNIPASVISIANNIFYKTAWYESQNDGLLYLDNWLLGFKGDEPAGAIEIKNGTTRIAEYAFMECWELTSITIPNSIETIGKGAFAYCGLTSIEIPSGVTQIEAYAFDECYALESIIFPNSLTFIGERAFRDCESLTALNIPDGVTDIGKQAFFGCWNLSSLNIPKGMTVISEETFTGCGLSSIDIPYSVTSIGTRAFAYCPIKSLFIPSSISHIGKGAFEHCEELKSITIEGVTEVDEYAFAGCEKLEELFLKSKEPFLIKLEVFSDDYNGYYTYNFDLYIPVGSEEKYWETYGYENTHQGVAFSAMIPIQYPYKVGNIWYDIISDDEKTVEVTTPFIKEIHDYDDIDNVAIPDLIDIKGTEYLVTRIGEYAFGGCSSLTSIELPDGLTSIGEGAFSNCGIESIIIPESVTSIGEEAFFGCNSLTSMTIPSSVTEIGISAFSSCSNLTTISISEGVTSIGDKTFYECSSLTSIDIPNSVTCIGKEAFAECSNLTTISVPEGVTSIGDKTFYECSSLTSISIPNSITTIGKSSFFSCENLSSIKLPESLIEIGSYAFYGCKGLTSLTLPTNVISIGDYAFANCSGITSLTIPDCLKAIGYASFSMCEGLTSLSLPESVKTIGDYAFGGCKNLSSLHLSEGLDTIGKGAFYQCTSLQSIELPENVSTIGDEAFRGCTGLSSLTTLTIPKSVSSIGQFAFSACEGLKTLIVNENVTKIGMSAFGSPSLDSLFWYSSTNPTDVLGYAYRESLKYVEIGGSLTSIGQTFSDCTRLTTLILAEGLTTIGDYAFEGCSNLSSLHLSEGLDTIGKGAFYRCTSLQSIELPESVSTIGDEAFRGCTGLSSLTTLTIPKSVTSIGKFAFSACEGLKTLIVNENVTKIGSVAFGKLSSLDSLFWYSSTDPTDVLGYAYKESLKYVEIGGNLTSIGQTFNNCTRLTTLILTEGLTAINFRAFYGCANLTYITIPASLDSIYDSAFGGCYNIKEIISYMNDPFELHASEIFSQPITPTLYVLPGTEDTYLNKGWGGFATILPIGIRNIQMYVFDESNNELAGNSVNILWYNNEGKQIGTGTNLNSVADSTELFYSILLDKEYGRIYKEVNMQKILSGKDSIICKLEKLNHVLLTGRVSATDIDKNPMTVTINQRLNGKYEQSYTTVTNQQGIFQIEAFDAETDIKICGEGYLDASIHRNALNGNGNIGVIPMNLISGFAIAANILFNTTTTGQIADASEWSSGLNNISFELFNETEKQEITDFTIQNSRVIIRSGAKTGDQINLVAKSKQGIFADASSSFIIREGANDFNLTLTELGGIDITCSSSSNSTTVGFLYNSNNNLFAKGCYIGDKLSLRHLPNGTYTLVSMGGSTLLGNMTNLSNLNDIGLVEGRDYVATNITIVNGLLTEININEVPRLDEARFYYTSSKTYFNANKASLTSGNYLTLSTHLDFKPNYSDKIDIVLITIEIPEGCQFVENTVIANRQAVTYTMDGNHIMMTLNKEQWQDQVRFCIIPLQNKTYTITAIASFDIDGNITQPIGTAQFEAKGLSLSMPKHTSTTTVIINGTAKSHSEVSIYDNNVLIGKTSSKADGTWAAACKLYKPYTHSFHEIYAKITTDNGMELTSETQFVEYEMNRIVPQKVTMTYYNGYYEENKTVEFNLLDGTANPSSYPFYSGTDFTFLADFNQNDISQIENVNIKVLNSDGTVRTLPASYNGKLNKWVATTKYSSSSRLPQNVTLDYNIIPLPNDSDLFDESIVINDNKQFYNFILNHVVNIDSTSLEVIRAQKDELSCQYQSKNMTDPVIIEVKHSSSGSLASTLDFGDAFMVQISNKQVLIKDSVLAVGHHVTYMQDIETGAQLQISIMSVNNNAKRAPVWIENGMEWGRNIWNTRTEWGRNIWNLFTNSVINLFCNAGDIMQIIDEYNSGYEDYLNWLNIRAQRRDDYWSLYNKTNALLKASCPDGYLRIHQDVYPTASKMLTKCFEQHQQLLSDFDNNLQRMETDLARRRDATSMISATFSLISIAASVRGVTEAGRSAIRELGEEILQEMGVNTVQAVYEHLIRNEFYTSDDMSNWFSHASSDLIKSYVDLQKLITESYKSCKEEKENKEEKNDEPQDENSEDKPDFNGKGSTPEIDPSGYVYEAVTSNRLEGVTATCYEKVFIEDMYGDITEEAVIWNAEDYSQQNPLKTDAMGFYRWDVPQGWWQVKYEKEGYETVYSEWLPVPPPQLDVNIAMKQSIPPVVSDMHGFESGITIELSKYMLPTTLNESTITVTRNGSIENGRIEMLNIEQEPLGNQSFVSKIKFIPENRFNTTDLVVVTIHKEVESYCGMNMEQEHIQTVEIESEIKGILADSIITVPYQGERELRILVLPKEASFGRTLNVRTSSSMIAPISESSVTIDKDGAATLTLEGGIPGSAVLNFSISGTDINATSRVQVTKEYAMVATPTSNILSGETIEGGSLLYLYCETEGSTIYYTLDGSCPCDEDKRILYDGPISITSDVIVKAIAEKEGMYESDIASFIYIVDSTNDIKYNSNILIEFKDGIITITGAEGASCNLTNINGFELYNTKNKTYHTSINVKTPDTYLISLKLQTGQILVYKVLAK